MIISSPGNQLEMIQSIFHRVKHHTELTDDEFEKEFRDLTLDPSLFNHEAHLRLGWIHITKYGQEKAIENICSQIRAFDLKHGDGTKFNRILTEKSIQVLSTFISESDSNDFNELIQNHPALRTDFMNLIDNLS